VELAPAPEIVPEAQPTFFAPQVTAQPFVPSPMPGPLRGSRSSSEDAAFRRRYGLDGSRKLPQAAPQPVAPVAVAPTARRRNPVCRRSSMKKQLAVTLVLNVVKLLPPPK